MPLVAGVDTSTQSCKVVIRDAETGALVREGRATHPEGTEVHPDAWWRALSEASRQAGGLDDVAAVAVGGQQHGMVCLDDCAGWPSTSPTTPRAPPRSACRTTG
jgi:xylulokinase